MQPAIKKKKNLQYGRTCHFAACRGLCGTVVKAASKMPVATGKCLEMNTPVHCKCFGQLAAGWAEVCLEQLSTMRKRLTHLTKSLGSLVTKRYVIVLVDVRPFHIDGSIFPHARGCGVRLVYIPAKLTSYFQSCDT